MAQARPIHNPAATGPARASLLSALACAGIALHGCSGENPSTDQASSPGKPGYDHAYTVRGRIAAMPSDDAPLVIRHEPIHGFISRDRALVGMNAMEMEFPHLADGVSLDGLEPGDPVIFTMEIDWDNSDRPWTVSTIEPIAGEPTLDLDGLALPRRNTADRSTDESSSIDRYTIRGVIEQLPSPDLPGSSLQIRHEAIDGFRNAQGRAIGMDSMTMPFPEWSQSVNLDQLSIGQPVVFTLEVTWRRSVPRTRITHMRPLPSDAQLVFRSAFPPEPR